MAAEAPAPVLQCQLITGQGELSSEFDAFIASTKLGSWGLDYQVVAIMGPQSSGKSTLLNHVFGSRFVEMDALSGRGQTTQGIWLAQARTGEEDIKTLVMDLEGTDGRERGEEEASFERQTALFAMASADVLLVNMWCHDIGREAGAGKPLLRTVLSVNLRLFSPRRTVLCFVVRDRTRTPAERLAQLLQGDLERIWASVPKPAAHADAPLDAFFDVRFAFLPNFEERAEEFKAEAAALGRRLFSRAASDAAAAGGDSLAAPAGAAVPGDGLQLSLRSTWEAVRANKDLDLPAHRVMVATVRCAQIAAAALQALRASADFAEIVPGSEAAAPQLAAALGRGLGARLAALHAACLAAYDAEAALFDSNVRVEQRERLGGEAAEALRPSLAAALTAGRARGAAAARAELAQRGAGDWAAAAAAAARAAEAAWREVAEEAAAPGLAERWAAALDASRARLAAEVGAASAAARAEALAAEAEALAACSLRRLAPAAAALLDAPAPGLWRGLRGLLRGEAARARAEAEEALGRFGPPPPPAAEPREEGAPPPPAPPPHDPAAAAAAELERLAGAQEARLRAAAEEKAAEAAAGAAARLKERFNRVFGHDEAGLPRLWRPSDDVDALAAAAKAAAAEALALLAVNRLGEEEEDDGGAFAEAADAAAAAVAAQAAGPPGEESPLHGAAWEGLPARAQLLSPPAARSAWRAFESDCGYAVLQARTAQEAARRAAGAGAPLWAVLAMVVLGFDELLYFLRHPLSLLALLSAALFLRALYRQMDVEATVVAVGLLPSLAILAARALPAAIAIFAKLVEAATTVGAPAAAAQAAAVEDAAAGVRAGRAGAEAAETALRRRPAAAASAASAASASVDEPAESQGSSGSKED